MKLQLALFATLCVKARVQGHGLLTVPPSKNGGTVSTPLSSTNEHYALAAYGIIDKAFFDNDHSQTPWTRPGDFDQKLARDLVSGHPQTLHPCGCNAGGVADCAGVVHAREFGATTQGYTLTPVVWPRGSTQETAWNAWVNHAGGHIYMLCGKRRFDDCRESILPANPSQATQEQKDEYLQCVWDCFESNTLEWDEGAPGSEDWSQKLQFRDDSSTYATMEPTTKVGKNGHVWRSTPIPDKLQVTNGGEGKCTWDSVHSFSSPAARQEFVASFGDEDVCDWGPDSHEPPDWHVFDKVKVPADLEEGEYLLSWRWEAYTADQMWTNCADVTIGPAGGPSSSAVPSQSPVRDAPSPTQAPTAPPAPSPAPPPPGSDCPSGYTGMVRSGDCATYHHCRNGQVDGEELVCPPGTLFDTELQYCNWSSLVMCEPQTQAPSPTKQPTKSPTSPAGPPTSRPECPSGYTGLRAFDDCTKYHNCQNGQVVGDMFECPQGTLFDSEFQYCNWDVLVTCEQF